MKIDIHNGFYFETDIEITDFRNKTYSVKMKKTEENDSQIVYSIDGENEFLMSGSIIQRKYANSIGIFIDFKCRKNDNWEILHCFDAYRSVCLKLKPSKNEYEVFCDNYWRAPETDCWARAAFCERLTDIPKSVANMLWKDEECYFVMAPMCDGAFKTTLSGGDTGINLVSSANMGGYTHIRGTAAVISFGENPYKTYEDTVKTGFAMLGKRERMRKDKKLPEMFEYLGWCSWDGFGRNITENGMYEKAEEIAEKDLPIKWMLIDDGWFPYENEMLKSFHEDEKKFPNGLKQLTDNLKSKYKIRWVGAWQCILGHWAGIAPDGELYREYKHLTQRTTGGYILPRCDVGGSVEFWNSWNEYLSNSGIDFVKVDVEDGVGGYTHSNMAVGEAVGNVYNGLESSVGLYYGGACINCTGMSTESIWNRYGGAVNRNSEDFVPTDVTSMPQFIADNLYNSLYNRSFAYPDFDMMWTDSPTTELNVVMHAVSGSLLYVSDKVGESDKSVIMPFVTEDGKLLKCDDIAVPAEDCLLKNPMKTKMLLKAQNVAKGSGVLAAFNISDFDEEITGEISPSDIYFFKERYNENTEFIVFDRNRHELRKCRFYDKLKIELNRYKAELFYFYPVTEEVTIIGLIDKYVPKAAVKDCTCFKNRYIVELECGGRLAFYSEKKPIIKYNGEQAEAECRDGLYVLDCKPQNEKNIIEIAV